MGKRAAVVIGVDRTGELTALESCATGAQAVAKWLREEGFDTIELTDANDKEVTAAMVMQAVSNFVNAQTYHQLILFFSGHGYWKNETELWLLSNAPRDANEAISWMETAEFAKDCGIPNIVMISDACRTIPKSKSAIRVRGSIVFPNENFSSSRSKVDKFMAAAIGQPAYETKLASEGTRTSVFTHCLLQAFREPYPDSVDQIINDGEPALVVTNRKLGPALQRRVPEVLAAINPTYAQNVDAEVLSDNDAFIARAKRPPAGAFPEIGAVQLPFATLRDVAAVSVSRELGSEIKISRRRLDRAGQIALRSGFAQKVNDAAVIPDVRRFEMQTGFTISGDSVQDVRATSGANAKILSHGGSDEPAVIRIDLIGRASSVCIRFGNRRATVLAALFGYIAHVTIKNNVVVSVNYVPSQNSLRWDSYARRQVEIEKLRAVSAAAARSGVFQLSDAKEAVAFAEKARIEKGIDPSLGLYASYAYLQADLRQSIASVLEYMQSDLEVLVYDVALLARHPALAGEPGRVVVPFCPMLTQGWNLLRSRKVTLPGVLDQAQDDLEASLWTTFKEKSASAIMEAIRKGELQ